MDGLGQGRGDVGDDAPPRLVAVEREREARARARVAPRALGAVEGPAPEEGVEGAPQRVAGLEAPAVARHHQRRLLAQ